MSIPAGSPVLYPRAASAAATGAAGAAAASTALTLPAVAGAAIVPQDARKLALYVVAQQMLAQDAQANEKEFLEGFWNCQRTHRLDRCLMINGGEAMNKAIATVVYAAFEEFNAGHNARLEAAALDRIIHGLQTKTNAYLEYPSRRLGSLNVVLAILPEPVVRIINVYAGEIISDSSVLFPAARALEQIRAGFPLSPGQAIAAAEEHSGTAIPEHLKPAIEQHISYKFDGIALRLLSKPNTSQASHAAASGAAAVGEKRVKSGDAEAEENSSEKLKAELVQCVLELEEGEVLGVEEHSGEAVAAPASASADTGSAT